MKKEIRFEIRTKEGAIRSRHYTFEAAQKQRNHDLGWRCGICGNNKSGWGKCSHGMQNRVCNADRYNDKIIQLG